MTRFQSWLVDTKAGRALLAVIAFLLPVLAALFVVILAGCAHGGNWHASASDANRTEETTLTAPTGALVANSLPTITTGHPVTIRQKITESSRQRDTGDTPKTGKQIAGQVIGWAAGLGTVGIAALAFLAPSTLAGWAIKSLFKWRAAFQETVAGVEAFKASGESAEKLKQNLAAAQSPATRRLVTVAKERA
jgi:hypothetical protein